MTRLNLALGLLSLTLGLCATFWAPGELLALWRANPDAARVILVELRLPRALLALLIGGTLGACGAALQGLLRNPLASPDIMGTSTGAAFGAVVTSYFFGVMGTAVLTGGAMAGAMLALILLLLLAGRNASTETLILAGVAISALGAALTNLALSLAPSPFALYDVLFWLLGSLADRSRDQLLWTAPPMILGIALLLRHRRALDRLALGEEVAISLGVRMPALRRDIVIGTGIAVGASVAAAGAIGFVGLVVPHLVRPLVGQRPGSALVPSILGGACLLTLADMAVRLPITTQEMKLGVLTALIGAPFFLHLILGRRGQTI